MSLFCYPVAYDTFIPLGYNDTIQLFVGYLTAALRYLQTHCHILRTTKLLEQPYFIVFVSMGKLGNQNTSISSSNRVASHFPCIPFRTCYDSFLASQHIPVISLPRHYYSQLIYKHLFPTSSDFYIRIPVSGR